MICLICIQFYQITLEHYFLEAKFFLFVRLLRIGRSKNTETHVYDTIKTTVFAKATMRSDTRVAKLPAVVIIRSFCI
jgi:hypothetical protein